MKDDEDQETKSIEECRHGNDWPKMNNTIKEKLNLLEKRKVFTLEDVTPVGYKWAFMRNEVRNLRSWDIKHDLFSYGGCNYNLIFAQSAIHENLKMHLMDIVTVNLYGSLKKNI